MHAGGGVGSLDDEDPDGDGTMGAELAFGLDRILDGIEVLIRSR